MGHTDHKYRLGRCNDFLYSYIYMHPNDQNDGSMELKSLKYRNWSDWADLTGFTIRSKVTWKIRNESDLEILCSHVQRHYVCLHMFYVMQTCLCLLKFCVLWTGSNGRNQDYFFLSQTNCFTKSFTDLKLSKCHTLDTPAGQNGVNAMKACIQTALQTNCKCKV